MAKSVLVKIANTDVNSKIINYRIHDEYLDKIDKVVILFRFDINDVLTLYKYQQVIILENFTGT